MLVLLLLLAVPAAAANAPPAGPAAVAAASGVGFGLDVTPPGAPAGAPMVLEARLARPGDPVDGPPLRWMVAASAGAPVRVAWEFAYDWEIIPGVWTLKVFHEDTQIASAEFDVSRAPTQPAAGRADSVQPGVKAKASSAKDDAHGGPDNTKAGAANAAKAVSDRPAPAKPAPNAQAQDSASPAAVPGATSQAAAKAAPLPAPAALSPPEPHGGVQTRPPAPAQAPKPPRQAARIVDGPQERTLHVLVGGVYSEEARALWVTVFLGKQGVKACVREEQSGQRKLWAVITGWRDTAGEALALKLEQAQAVGDIFLRAMTAAELNKGLVCP